VAAARASGTDHHGIGPAGADALAVSARRVSAVAREGVQQAIEDIVTAFTEAKLAQAKQGNGTPSDAALDITALDSPNSAPPYRPTHDAIDAVGEHPRRLDGPEN
jgi:hypothetical protein